MIPFFPDPARPVMMMRFRSGQSKPEHWSRTFPVIQANKACFDEIWFSTGVGVFTLEEHRKRSADMAAAAEDLRKIGVIPSLQIQATLGHSDIIAASAGAAGKQWGSYVGRGGEECQFINCPRQPGFLEYWREVSKIYAQWHPGSVWLDDDLRLRNHFPAMDNGGCYCQTCLARFAEEEGKLYSREELVAACETDKELEQRWLAFGIRSLCNVAKVITENFCKYSPETRVGLQHGEECWRHDLFRTIRETSGKRITSRCGGGAYFDRSPFAILDKGILCAIQKYQQAGYDVFSQVCAEIESCPRVFSCKTSQGHRLESLYYLALGMDSLSYFIMAPDFETPEWYGKNLLAPLAAETAAYKEYLRVNAGTEPGGVGIFSLGQTRIDELGLPLIGTAFAGASPGRSCTFVNLSGVQNSSDEELKRCLQGDIIVSGSAVEALEKRGLGEYIGFVHAERANLTAQDCYEKHPLCQGFEEMKYHCFRKNGYSFSYKEDSSIQVLTRFKDHEGRDWGAGTLLLTRPDGSRAALIGCGFDSSSLPTSRVTLLNRIADWVSHETLPVLPAEPMQAILIPRIDAKRTLRSVLVVNPTIGVQKELKLILRNIPSNARTAKWIIPAEQPLELPIQCSAEAAVTIPELAAWNIGFLEFQE